MAVRVSSKWRGAFGLDSVKVERRGRFAVVPKEQRTVDGIVFASGKEAKRYVALRHLERAGVIKLLVVQPVFLISINGKHFCKYTADFQYYEEGRRVIEDVKSGGTAKDAAYRLRKKAAELMHGITITEVIV